MFYLHWSINGHSEYFKANTTMCFDCLYIVCCCWCCIDRWNLLDKKNKNNKTSSSLIRKFHVLIIRSLIVAYVTIFIQYYSLICIPTKRYFAIFFVCWPKNSFTCLLQLITIFSTDVSLSQVNLKKFFRSYCILNIFQIHTAIFRRSIVGISDLL